METTTSTAACMEIWHKDFNLEKRDNIDEIPELPGVFGIFGIIDNEPVNCRYVEETENLRKAVRSLFEHPTSEGLKKFMQGAWIQMLQFEIVSDTSKQERESLLAAWVEKYEPGIDAEGDYPGYYSA